MPQQLFVHGYLLLDDRKISKSLGNVIDPLDLVDVYGSDAVRFWALRSVSFGQDGSASIDALHERYERELGNDLGNLVSRTTAMVARYRDGRVAPGQPNEELQAALDGAAGEARRALRRLGPDRRARGDLGARPLAQPPRRGDGAVAAGQGRGARRRARRGPLRPRRRPARGRGRARRRTCRETAPQILAALGQPVELELERVAYGLTPETDGIEPAAPLFPRVDQPTAAA